MSRLTITAKIWLSIGVFILGYVLSTALGQVQSNQTRASLEVASAALFPAAQRSQEAEAAFQRMVKGFGDAVIMQDAGAVEKAAEEGRQTVAALRTIGAIRGLAAGRGEQAASAADAVERLLEDARKTYSAVLAGQMDAGTQDQVRALATRNEELKTSLGKLKETAAGDLLASLRVLQAAASRQNTIALAMFVVTLVLASVIVSMTVRRAITGPVLRVIDGVRASADESARTAGEIAQSGTEVSNNAQEQAAFVEETSATLEEISATTRQNADRAGHADKLMQEARQTVDRAAHAMNDLTSSMNLISKSSNQVVGVLKTIDEIAFHTNILALNAAVEAARAGEVGAGFSVVADEVRSLAHRAAEAARESGSIVEQTLRDVSRGVELAGLAHRAFQEVSTQITGGSDIVTEIAASSNEQARGVANIGQAIGRIESVTQQNAANAQRTADGAAAMTSQVDSTRQYLQQLVELVGLRAV